MSLSISTQLFARKTITAWMDAYLTWAHRIIHKQKNKTGNMQLSKLKPVPLLCSVEVAVTCCSSRGKNCCVRLIERQQHPQKTKSTVSMDPASCNATVIQGKELTYGKGLMFYPLSRFSVLTGLVSIQHKTGVTVIPDYLQDK